MPLSRLTFVVLENRPTMPTWKASTYNIAADRVSCAQFQDRESQGRFCISDYRQKAKSLE
jgi:hypothetical protein